MSEPLSAFDTGRLAPDTLAVLLDFDGTLVSIVDDPDGVVLTEHTVRTLARLEGVLGGAVAIVSGRSIAEIDRIFAPRRFPVAGIHGLERRDSQGRHHEDAYDAAVLDEIARRFGEAIACKAGLKLERKAGSVALHYRRRPELESFCRALAAEAIALHPEARRITGKMVVELKLGARTKADAVSDFMAEPPFAGRRPLYAGDDVTDEDAFRAVAAFDGISIKIGCGGTAALYRVADTESFLGWLDTLSESLAARRARADGAEGADGERQSP